MIEESEKLKSGLESKAEHLADRLVPYTLAGHWPGISADKKCNQGTVRADGRFLLRTEAGYADFGTVRHP